MKFFWKTLKIFWAGPYSLVGIAIGVTGMLTGGKAGLREGAIEFYEGGTRWFVRHLPTGERTAGLTLGHVILGQSEMGMRYVGEHERVHVRQYECWGPIMGPAYLLCSLWMWLDGRDAYLDNPFEVEAYRVGP